MSLMCQIKVEDLRFFSYHGFYADEQLLGNEYFVSIAVDLPLKSPINDDLENTLNYEELYEIAKTEMAIPRKLLESVAQDILLKTKSKCQNPAAIKIKICKVNPPFGGDQAKSIITLSWENNDSENDF